MGGLAWFAIPFGFATTLGLAAVALADHPQFPTYPNLPSESDISAGLASALSASALLGTSGAVALLLSLFLAVTSCASAELIAVSSILTFDIYKSYFHPQASPNRLIFVSKVCICIFGLTMSLFAVIWNAIGVDLGWLFLVMGLLIGGAVFPAAFAITWTGQSTAGAIAGPIAGLCAGIIAWLVTAQRYFGELTIASTGHEYSTLAGNMAAIFTGLIVTVVVSLVKPQNFDWAITRGINSPPVTDLASAPVQESEQVSLEAKGEQASANASGDEKETKDISRADAQSPSMVPTTTLSKEEEEASADADIEEHPVKLRRALIVAYISAVSLTLIMDFLVSRTEIFCPSLHLVNRMICPFVPSLTTLKIDPYTDVLLPLHLLPRLLHRLDRDLFHLGIRLDVHQLHPSGDRDQRLLEEIHGQGVARHAWEVKSSRRIADSFAGLENSFHRYTSTSRDKHACFGNIFAAVLCGMMSY